MMVIKASFRKPAVRKKRRKAKKRGRVVQAIQVIPAGITYRGMFHHGDIIIAPAIQNDNPSGKPLYVTVTS